VRAYERGGDGTGAGAPRGEYAAVGGGAARLGLPAARPAAALAVRGGTRASPADGSCADEAGGWRRARRCSSSSASCAVSCSCDGARRCAGRDEPGDDSWLGDR
jgi:hypothetical protein